MDYTDYGKEKELKVAYLCNGKRECFGKLGCSYGENRELCECKHTTDKLYSLTGKDFYTDRDSFEEIYPDSNIFMEVEK